MPLDYVGIRAKVKKAFQSKGFSMTLVKKTQGEYDVATGKKESMTAETTVWGMVFDASHELQTLAGGFTECKRIMFAFEPNSTPLMDDEIKVLDKTFHVVKVLKTLPLVGEDIMYSVLVKR